MAAFTADQMNWLIGFWTFFQEAARPTKAGPKQDGWDAAQAASGSGGY